MTRRSWLTKAMALAFAGAVALLPSQTFAARFTITGTIYDIDAAGKIYTIITSDIIGKPQPIMVDVSYLKKANITQEKGSPIALDIESREYDTYLAIGLVGEGSYTPGTDFSTLEQFTTKDDSIKAHVGNGPEDDEARAGQNRDRYLRKKEDKKDD
jgi:hypothetical protein